MQRERSVPDSKGFEMILYAKCKFSKVTDRLAAAANISSTIHAVYPNSNIVAQYRAHKAAGQALEFQSSIIGCGQCLLCGLDTDGSRD